MLYFRKLFWCSATYNFHIKAVHITGHNNVLADHASRLNDAVHFCAFLQFTHQGATPRFFHYPALQHMSTRTYAFLFAMFAIFG